MRPASRVVGPSAAPGDGAILVLDRWGDATGAGGGVDEALPAIPAPDQTPPSRAAAAKPAAGMASPFVTCSRCGIGVHVHATGHACIPRGGGPR